MNTADADRAPEADRVKRPYEAPSIVSREPLEAVAGTCTPPSGKADPSCTTPGS